MGKILVADGSVNYVRIYEALNDCFGTSYTGWMRAEWMPKSKSFSVWFPKLAKCIDGKYVSASFGCVNILSEDGNTITFNDEKDYGGAQPDYANNRRPELPILVFAKEPNDGPYVFKGVFLFDDVQSSYLHSVYKRIAESVCLSGYPVERIEF